MSECVIDSEVQADVVLKPRRAQPFFGRHPWVFAGAIERVVTVGDAALAPGAIVRLTTSDQRFVAYGMWNEASRIRVRLYSWSEEQSLDAAFWRTQVARAVASRRLLFDLQDPQSACRLIFSESDGLSGLTVDRYGDYLLVQFTSRAMYEVREVLVQALLDETHAKGIWLRTEKGMREAEGLEVSDGLVHGRRTTAATVYSTEQCAVWCGCAAGAEDRLLSRSV
jgi:23S rRNA (cytosine1962-C5)-methyltransferase